MEIGPLAVFFRITRDVFLNLGSGWLALGLFSFELYSEAVPVRLWYSVTHLLFGIICLSITYIIERSWYD